MSTESESGNRTPNWLEPCDDGLDSSNPDGSSFGSYELLEETQEAQWCGLQEVTVENAILLHYP